LLAFRNHRKVTDVNAKQIRIPNLLILSLYPTPIYKQVSATYTALLSIIF